VHPHAGVRPAGTPRDPMPKRALNIALRTVHLAAMGVLIGGHAFDVEPDLALEETGMTVGTGVVLAAVESEGSLLWFHQGRGILTLLKLALLALVPALWTQRLFVLFAVLGLGAVGAHMPARYRYYSVLHRRIVPHGCGPGVDRLRETREEAEP